MRNLDDAVVDRLKARANENKQSLEREVRAYPEAIGQSEQGLRSLNFPLHPSAIERQDVS